MSLVQHLQKPPMSAPLCLPHITTRQQCPQVNVSLSHTRPAGPVPIRYPPGRCTYCSWNKNAVVAVAVPPEADLVRIASPARFVAGPTISDPGLATHL